MAISQEKLDKLRESKKKRKKPDAPTEEYLEGFDADEPDNTAQIEKTFEVEARQYKKASMDKKMMNKNMKTCLHCMDSDRFKKEKRHELLLSVSPRAYVCMDEFATAVIPDQVCICPQDHIAATTDMDEETYTEIRNYQKSLARFFDEQEPARRVIFVESCIRRVSKDQSLLGAGGHAVMVAYPVSLEVFEDAKVYFKKALDEAECEFVTQHKKVIPTEAKKGVRGAVPQNFPYVHIDFCLQGGFAHVVEDAEEFPKDFAQHTIAGMCELTVLDRAYISKADYKTATEDLRRRFKEGGFDWAAGLQQDYSIERGPPTGKDEGKEKAKLAVENANNDSKDSTVTKAAAKTSSSGAPPGKISLRALRSMT